MWAGLRHTPHCTPSRGRRPRGWPPTQGPRRGRPALRTPSSTGRGRPPASSVPRVPQTCRLRHRPGSSRVRTARTRCSKCEATAPWTLPSPLSLPTLPGSAGGGVSTTAWSVTSRWQPRHRPSAASVPGRTAFHPPRQSPGRGDPAPLSVLTQGPEASVEKPVPKGLIQEGRRLPRPFPPALPAQACARDKPAHGQPTARAQASAGHPQRRHLEVLGLLGCLLSRPPRCLLCFQHLPRPERLTGWSVKVKVTGDKRTAGRAQTLCSGVTARSTVCD